MKQMKRLIVFLCMLAVLAGGCADFITQSPPPAPVFTEIAVARSSGNEDLTVWFLDVGQADSIVVSDGEHTVLVDAGNRDDGDDILRFLEEQDIDYLDYAVGTHPHEDHIGGMAKVISNVPVGAVILPDVDADTKTYRDMLEAMETTGIARTDAVAGALYPVGIFQMQILGPVAQYDDLNNSSAVVRIEYGETSFLLTGDIEERAEKDILAAGYDVSCDVLKAAHHGSESSSSYVFLRQSNPEMIVISCGADNSYGHPHDGPMSRYRDLGATVYRTDFLGTLRMTSDGSVVTAHARGIESPVERAADGEDGLAQGEEVIVAAYIGNRNSKALHRPECTNLPAEQNRMYFDSYQEAVDAGYKPCGVCKPVNAY